MKKLFLSDSVRILLALFATVGLAGPAFAAGKKDAQITQVIRDVKVLASKAGARPAAVNDPVQEGQAVRTGGDSRAELTFTDATITRLGANTIFTYGQGAKEFDLSSGAALIVVPKEAGSVKINTAAATAAVTGFVALFESHPKGVNKYMVLEGEACVKRRVNGVPVDPCVTLHSGEMLVIQPGSRGSVEKFNIKKTSESALLLTGFDKLPKWALDDLQGAIDAQDNGNPGGGGKGDHTGLGVVDQKSNASPTPAPQPNVPPPGSPPGGRSLRHGRP